jgi:hypothetical protein
MGKENDTVSCYLCGEHIDKTEAHRIKYSYFAKELYTCNSCKEGMFDILKKDFLKPGSADNSAAAL